MICDNSVGCMLDAHLAFSSDLLPCGVSNVGDSKAGCRLLIQTGFQLRQANDLPIHSLWGVFQCKWQSILVIYSHMSSYFLHVHTNYFGFSTSGHTRSIQCCADLGNQSFHTAINTDLPSGTGRSQMGLPTTMINLALISLLIIGKSIQEGTMIISNNRDQ